MAFESLLSLLPIPAVHAKPDAARVSPEAQDKREKKQQKRAQHEDGQAHPVPNAQGQITGKVIDTTA